MHCVYFSWNWFIAFKYEEKKCEQAHTPYASPLLDNAIYTERMAALNTQNNFIKNEQNSQTTIIPNFLQIMHIYTFVFKNKILNSINCQICWKKNGFKRSCAYKMFATIFNKGPKFLRSKESKFPEKIIEFEFPGNMHNYLYIKY